MIRRLQDAAARPWRAASARPSSESLVISNLQVVAPLSNLRCRPAATVGRLVASAAGAAAVGLTYLNSESEGFRLDHSAGLCPILCFLRVLISSYVTLALPET